MSSEKSDFGEEDNDRNFTKYKPSDTANIEYRLSLFEYAINMLTLGAPYISKILFDFRN